MASGTIKGKFTNLSASHLYPEIRWRSTKNDKNNNSSVTAELWFVRVNTAYISNNAYFLPRITINGNAAYPPSGTYAPFDMRKGTHKVWQRTVTVAHNADGNKSITIEAGGITGLSNLGNVSVSGTAKLDRIPRASSISSISGNQIGGKVTVNISRASNSFKHIVKYTNTAGGVSTVGENVDTSKTFTISMNDCSHLPNSTSGTAKITVDTYSGNTRIGSVTKNHTVYVPDSVKPTFEWVTIKELSHIKNLNLGENRFVQGKSYLQMQVHGTAHYGATINKASVGITGVRTIQSNAGTISLSDFPWAVGNLQLVGTITDSRGRSASGSIGFTILPFSNPVIHSFSASRIDNGTSISVFKRIEASRVDVDKTVYVVYVDRKINGGWTQIHSETSTNTETITLDGFDLASSHELRLRINDYFQSVSSVTTISTAKTLMDFNKDIGVGIGKVHENGALDVGGNTYINGNLYLKGISSSVKSTINWTVPNASSTGVFTHLYRNNGKMISALYHSTGDDTLGMNMYDQNGNYKINKFLPDGGVNFAGRIWSGSYITATGDINTTNGIILENGKRVATRTHGEDSLIFQDPNFSPYNAKYSEGQHPKVYLRDGSIVTISGAIKNNVVVASGWSGDIAQLPSWVPFPRNEVNGIAQGSHNSTFLITIRKNGRIGMTRYRNGNTSVAVPVGSWLNVSFTYAANLG